ncbi:MAG: steroid 5-alpha reductase [Anaerolineae bacterium]|nr:MAG: steroid 5-alpha reductase [Anaerolineae bacterium]
MFKQKYFIDSHKGITFLAILAMIAWFGRWENITAWTYLALHGTYGILWVLKSRIFPDKQWEIDKGPAYALLILGGLSAYWVSPFLITWQNVNAPAWLIGLTISMNIFGVFFHFTSDMQKYIQLKYHAGHLITDGMFAHSRNINYFGELLIYLSFALLSMHWLPLVILAVFVFGFWLGFMRKKDKSLSRYPEFSEYKKKSKLFIPFLF